MCPPSPQKFDLSRFKNKDVPAPSGRPPGSDPSAPGTVHERGSDHVGAAHELRSPQVSVRPQVNVVAKERRTQAILASIETLPSLPSVVMQVMQLANDDDASASDFEAVIRKDQALTAKVLRLVNSPFFGLKQSIESIPHAIVVLGMKSLRSVVLAARTSRLLDRQLTPYGLGDQGMWRHSISCAMLGGDLAQRLGADASAQEAAFVGGLLHDVGKILLAPHLSAAQPMFGEALAQSGDLCAVETEFLGMSHADAGARMARQWELPASLIHVIEHHHQPPKSNPQDLGLAVTQIANELCNRVGVGRVAGPAEPSIEWDVLTAGLDLPPEETLLEESRIRLEALDPSFKEMVRH